MAQAGVEGTIRLPMLPSTSELRSGSRLKRDPYGIIARGAIGHAHVLDIDGVNKFSDAFKYKSLIVKQKISKNGTDEQKSETKEHAHVYKSKRWKFKMQMSKYTQTETLLFKTLASS